MKKAFSLIELVIAITIIGILSALIVPKVVQYIKISKDNVLKYNLSSMRRALATYAKDHDGLYPRSLIELTKKGYLSSIPLDPHTETARWEIAIWSPSNGKNYWVKNAGVYVTSDRNPVIPLTMYSSAQLAALGKTADFYRWDSRGICNVRIGDSKNPNYTRRGEFDTLSTDEAETLNVTPVSLRFGTDFTQLETPPFPGEP